MKKILIIYGTRPEYLKIKPILKNNNGLFLKSLHIKQHHDIIDFGNPDYTIDIESSSTDRLNNLFSEITKKLGSIIQDFDSILIQGDTATVAASAICAFNLKKQIIYLESGLRSFDLDNPYPEEGYRQMVARISSIHLCPTELSKSNLLQENIKNPIYVVGNTCLDNLLEYKKNTNYFNKILITLHRNENISLIDKWISAIDQIAKKHSDIEFIFPVHPNPIIQKASQNSKNINLINPLEHHELITLMKDCKLIITDSGGIQEEASFLNKKIIVCRKTTERPEAISTGHINLCGDPNQLANFVELLINDFIINKDSPYGDGYASLKILKILENV